MGRRTIGRKKRVGKRAVSRRFAETRFSCSISADSSASVVKCGPEKAGRRTLEGFKPLPRRRSEGGSAPGARERLYDERS